MQPYDFTTPGTPPQGLVQRHGGFIVVLAILIGLILYNHAGSPAAVSTPSVNAQEFGASMKNIFSNLLSIVAQIAFLLMLIRILWPIVRFFGMIIIGMALLGMLWFHGIV